MIDVDKMCIRDRLYSVYIKIYDQVYQPLHEFKFVVCYNVYSIYMIRCTCLLYTSLRGSWFSPMFLFLALRNKKSLAQIFSGSVVLLKG